MKKEKSCGSVVFNNNNNEVLIIKHNLGHWDFPKGHMEENETEYETAIREVKEETNIDIVLDYKYRYVITYEPFPNTIKDVVYFIGKAKNSDVKNQEEEVSIVKFVSVEEAFNLLTFDNAKNILKKVLEDMNK